VRSEYETVSVWVGSFESEGDFEAYFEESYESDDLPISPFAAGQGEQFYDHDFVERSFHTPTHDPDRLLAGHSFSRSYAENFAQAFHQHVGRPINAIVLVWNNEIDAPRSVDSPGCHLIFLGTFPCDPSADEL
jgi:hypothetical protein